ncbi:MAG TPA: ATP-binding protein [Alphaproteobacteria bacterium]|nr:ATP-binding protein [Alphaproteobacteria bacterium]
MNSPLATLVGSPPRLRRKLLLLVLSLLLPALMAGAVSLRMAYHSERQSTERLLAETARALTLAIDRQQGQAEAALFALAQSEHIAARDFAAFDAQARRALRLPDSWVLLEEEGRQLVNTKLPPGTPLPKIGNEHWAGLTPGQARVSNLFIGLVARQPVASTELLFEVDGRRYALNVISPYQTFNRILADQGLPSNWIGAILDRKGAVIARSREAERFVGQPGTPETVAWVKAGTEQEAVTQTRSLDGTETVVAYSRSAVSGWTLLVAVPLADITRTAWQTAGVLLVSGGLLLALGVLLAAWAARSIARPVEALAADAAALGRGDAVPARRTGLREADAVSEAMQEAGAALRSREDELRRLNAALTARAAASEGERDRLFELSNDLFAVAGTDGALTAINPAWERLLGRGKADILATPLPALVHQDDRAAAGAMLDRLRAGETVQRFEQRLIRADGQPVWVSWTSVPQGRLFYAVGRDITAAKEQQLALVQANARLQQEIADRERAEARLVQAQKIEALGQLTGGIAHDFNNLLTVVMGNLDLLRRSPEERRPRLIENAMLAVEQGRRLTAQLLAFGRRQALQPDVVAVNGLVRDMKDMLAQSLRGDIRIEFDLADDLWPVRIDAAQLRIALINLAANARDAMPKGGTFRVRTRNTFGHTGGESVAVEVADTGIGMPADVLARAFDPFFTTKPVGKGTGLGLAQVHGFVEQSGGSVDLRSQAGHGTTVTLHLPRADAQPMVGEPEAARPEPRRSAHILLVEDNQQVAELAATLLGECGHTVLHAADAAEALSKLEAGARFDLVFSDIVMPGELDGLDLAREIRRRHPDLPVVLATGYNESAGDPEAEGFPLLRKPYRSEDLQAAVAAALTQDRRGALPFKGNVVPFQMR